MNPSPYRTPYRPTGWRAWKQRLPADFPWVTAIIGLVTVLVFIAQVLSEALTGVDWPVQWGIKYTPLIVQYHQYWRLLTPMLLHGGIIHIGLNMWGLYVLGPTLEKLMGWWRFLLLYLLSAYAGNVLSTVFTLAPSLGASTAVFGLLGAYLVVFYTNAHYLGSAARSMVQQALLWIVINLVWSLQSGIDMWGHVGGLLGGMLFALMGGPRWRDFGGKAYDYGAAWLSLRDRRPYRDVVIGAVVTFAVFTAVLVIHYPQVLP